MIHVEVQYQPSAGIWKKLIPTSSMTLRGLEDFRGGEGNCKCSEIARELKVEPEYVTELLQLTIKLVTDEECLLTDEQRNWYLEMNHCWWRYCECWLLK